MLLPLAVMATAALRAGLIPLPQCQERGEGRLTFTGASSTLESDDAFSKEWLSDRIAAVCRHAPGAHLAQPVRISLLLPGAVQAKALRQHGMTLSTKLGQEGYLIDVDATAGVLVAAQNRSGLFHGAQTLYQMLRTGNGACQIEVGRIEDWPDTPMRGVYAVGSWYDAAPPGNMSFLNSTIDEMARSKHSFIMFNANGAEILFAALRDPSSPSSQRTIQYYKYWQAYCANRGIELIPQILSGSSGPNDYVNADISDGVWVKEEPFIVGASDVLQPVHRPVTAYPPNGNFSAGLSTWKILKHGDNPHVGAGPTTTGSNHAKTADEISNPPPPLCWHNASFGPRPGLGSAMCEFTGATPAAPHSLTMGIQSSTFPIDQGGIYAWSAWVWTGGTDMRTAAAVLDMQFSVNEVGTKGTLPPVDYHRGSGQPMGRRSVGTWTQLSGTLLGSSATNGSGYVLGWMDGNATTGRFAIADVRILRLNSALVNVVRTAASDINVSSEDGLMQYERGKDFDIENAPLPNKARSEDLFAAFASNNTYKLRRLPGGRLKPGQRVKLSFDVLGGLVGEVGDGAHLNSFAEPLYFEWMRKVIQFTMRTLNCKRIMFGFDEMRGFNRDSRSRALGRSNAETLAYTINKLQSFMSTEDPDSRAMVWADMLCPFHNGGRPHYQQYSGGVEGATWHAAAMLNKKVIVVPWWYGGYATAEWPVNCSQPNTDKGCTDPGTDCGNVRCAMNNQPGYWGAREMDWLAAGGTTADNLATWSRLQSGHTNALGIMTTQWSSPPNTAGIPYAGEYGWNQAQTQRTTGCGVA